MGQYRPYTLHDFCSIVKSKGNSFYFIDELDCPLTPIPSDTK
ncbi:Uncharacterised protein [Paraprevotella clara]|uniref:Uncharacterized protein n=1 Tax=Paraprevotella clara TaxID=454154 RepID=A0A6N3GB41_9BACT